MGNDGKMVHSHKCLVMVFSPLFRSILSLTTTGSSSIVVSFPDVLSSDLEQVLFMLLNRWDIVTMSEGLKNVFHSLGIDIKNVLVTQPAKVTRSDNSRDGSSNCEEVMLCNFCDEVFDHTSDDVASKVAIHLGEFHLENEAQNEHLKLFPAQKCLACGEKIHRKDARKLHTITEHAWENLKSNISQIVAKKNVHNSTEKIVTNEGTPERPRRISRKRDVPISRDGREDGLKKAQCTLCDKKWKQEGATNVSALRRRIKNHICKKHFDADMTVLLAENFSGGSCRRCALSIKYEEEQKRHIQDNHGVFDDVLKPMLEDILRSVTDNQKRKGRGEKEKLTSKRIKGDPTPVAISPLQVSASDLTKLLQSPPPKTYKMAEKLEETSDFKELQSCIEYSDSDDDDSDSGDLNDIQSNIDYSDSSDED